MKGIQKRRIDGEKEPPLRHLNWDRTAIKNQHDILGFGGFVLQDPVTGPRLVLDLAIIFFLACQKVSRAIADATHLDLNAWNRAQSQPSSIVVWGFQSCQQPSSWRTC
jgi:hypothetical protein